MLEEVEKIVEGSGQNNRAVPVEKVEDRTRETKVGSLYHLSAPELEDRVDSEDNLEERESFCCWVVFKDVFTSYS